MICVVFTGYFALIFISSVYSFLKQFKETGYKADALRLYRIGHSLILGYSFLCKKFFATKWQAVSFCFINQLTWSIVFHYINRKLYTLMKLPYVFKRILFIKKKKKNTFDSKNSLLNILFGYSLSLNLDFITLKLISINL